MRRIIDAFRITRILTVLKSQRCGMSLAARCFLAWAMLYAPGNGGIIWPTKELVRDSIENELAPMFRQNPALESLMPPRAIDFRQFKLRLDNHCYIQTGWATSLNTMIAKTLRYLYLEEPAEYENAKLDIKEFSSARTTTWRDRATIAIFGHPRTRQDAMWAAWEQAPVKLFWHRPCPHCEQYFPPAWQNVRLGLPDDFRREHGNVAAATYALLNDTAWEECPHCHAEIREHHKHDMNLRGVWAAEDAQITEEEIDREHQLQIELAHFTGDPKPYKYGNIIWMHLDRGIEQHHLGFHISAIYSPWVSYSELAMHWLNAQGNAGRLVNFFATYLGWLYEPESKGVARSIFTKKRDTAPPPRILPPWTTLLVASADPKPGPRGETGHIDYGIRAWGQHFRSQLIDTGRVQSFSDLQLRCLETGFPIRDRPDVQPVKPHVLCIDAGGGVNFYEEEESEESAGVRANAVYSFAFRDGELAKQDPRIVPVRGFGGKKKMQEPWRERSIAWRVKGKQTYYLNWLLVNPDDNKDILDYLIHVARGDEEEPPNDYWDVHSDIDETYIAQMTAEQRQLYQGVWRWMPISEPANNDYWDIEYYSCAIARKFGADTRKPLEDLHPTKGKSTSKPKRRINPATGRPIGSY